MIGLSAPTSPYSCPLMWDNILTRSAQLDPDAAALVANDTVYSYGVLDRTSSQLAGWVAAQGARSRVAVILPNSFEWMVCAFAISKSGAALVPLNPTYTDRELSYILVDASVELIFCRSSHLERLKALQADVPTLRHVEVIDSARDLGNLLEGLPDAATERRRDWNSSQSILYTSGTTGRPKGAVVSHRARVVSSVSCQLDLGFTKQTRLNCPLPLFHSGAQALFMTTLVAAGGTLILPRDASPGAALEAIREHGANVLAAVPTIAARYLESNIFIDSTKSLPLELVHGGASMPGQVAERFLNELKTWSLAEVYGATEAPQLTVLNGEEYRRNPTFTGRPLSGCDVRVVDADGNEVAVGQTGRVVSAGPHLFDGYLNEPEKTAQVLKDGVFDTGDIGLREPRGYISIVGRTTDVIISGGLNVYSREIEELLHIHPKVRDASVFAVPDQKWGEAIGVAIVCQPSETLTSEDVVQFCLQNLAPYKKPRHVWFVDEFPLTPSGKVKKVELRERLVVGRPPE
ncbi:class I adenylate-forming enzyme family protein [Bradyrhizobium sp. CB82]|uniref:class I adenylate-forming enzyme family protein n=1 Tax=Bradyrhizobium sp. CB82 TaxID=3039159 RepID=UPI0024B124DF|nr:class I adenylate-forming enzyme family protein [Bradyrhizobium sp. CB82]WFU41533.1 class I adenylate-forming enzyme family protein [Bradyrhizobium sp. CB82]